MSTHKHIDKICCVALAFTILLTVLFINAESFGVQRASSVMGYEKRLFDTSVVHTIDIVMDDWDSFIETCTDEEYADCSVVIDGEAYKNVAIRAKGNTSLTQVQSYGNDRYSFKIEFDRYDSAKSYYGLDKLCLNNIIQDNTYMKDYLTYRLMDEFGVASPLCSYVNITVNGEEWGLYLAVEGVEDSFLQRNYGIDYGELYKPDSMSMGGGRGNGKDFELSQWEGFGDNATNTGTNTADDSDTALDNDETGLFSETNPFEQGGRTPNGMTTPEMGGDFSQGGMPPPGMDGDFSQGGMTPPTDGTDPFEQGGSMPDMSSIGSRDVSLIYSDDEYDSYSNIFENAKTDITDADKDRLIEALKDMNENANIESVVDVEQVIRYFVVHNFVLNFDSYTGSMIHNYYLYEDDGELSMIPWDYNLAFGGFMSSSDATSLVNYPIDSPVSGGTTDSRPMLAWIFNNEEYTELYHTYFAEFIAQYFESDNFTKMIDLVKEIIASYVENDPTKFYTYEEFEKGIDTLKEFCLLRAESISGQLEGLIASTSEDQQDKSGFIDASDVVISDMGGMGIGMPTMPSGLDRGDGEDGENAEVATPNLPEGMEWMPHGGAEALPSDSGATDFADSTEMPHQDQSGAEFDAGGERLNMDLGDMQLPKDVSDGDAFVNQLRNSVGNTQGSGASTADSLLTLGVSAGVLVLGIVVAFAFKRRTR